MKNLIKKVLKKSSIYIMLKKTIKWYHNQWDFDILQVYATYTSSIKFIQIGSNDGMHGDPVCEYIKRDGWKGILVEPVPYLFEKLKENYKDFHHHLNFENSAIANENGTLKFYRLKESDLPNLPEWYDQLGSFNKDVVLKHRNYIPLFDELFIEDTVNTITFKELLRRYSIKNLNLIHIDTEGYDYEIIKMLPFSDIHIDLIQFEHKHLSILDYKNALQLLSANGYKIHKTGESDSIAIRKDILSILKNIKSKNIAG